MRSIKRPFGLACRQSATPLDHAVALISAVPRARDSAISPDGTLDHEALNLSSG
jgi:hypothetical protein